MKKIICPSCGAEYLPCEIFIPDVFFGKQINVDKDSLGKVVDYGGTNGSLKESYKCDYCDTTFIVDTVIKFNTREKNSNFNETYSTKLNKPNLFMKED